MLRYAGDFSCICLGVRVSSMYLLSLLANPNEVGSVVAATDRDHWDWGCFSRVAHRSK